MRRVVCKQRLLYWLDWIVGPLVWMGRDSCAEEGDRVIQWKQNDKYYEALTIRGICSEVNTWVPALTDILMWWVWLYSYVLEALTHHLKLQLFIFQKRFVSSIAVCQGIYFTYSNTSRFQNTNITVIKSCFELIFNPINFDCSTVKMLKETSPSSRLDVICIPTGTLIREALSVLQARPPWPQGEQVKKFYISFWSLVAGMRVLGDRISYFC